MDELLLLDLAREAIVTLLIALIPFLGAMLVVGLAVSVVQAVTQVNEQSLVFIPKILVTFLILLIGGSWIAHQLSHFTMDVFALLPVLRR